MDVRERVTANESTARAKVRLRLRVALCSAALLLYVAGIAQSQAVGDLLQRGDRERDARRAAAALVQYEAALAAAPESYGALWRASGTLIDLAEYHASDSERKAMFARAGALARRAVAVNPTGIEGHFSLARALGREALTVSARERTGYALNVRESALKVLAVDSLHPGGLHVMGRWNAEIMRLNSLTRMIARRFMGGAVFSEASWGEAVRLLETAVRVEPHRMVHLLALAQVYRDSGDPARARTLFEAAIKAPLTDYNDEQYRREARLDLASLR